MTQVAPVEISTSEARDIVVKWLRENKQFAAINTKVDGSKRKWSINPKAGRAFLMGTGQAQVTNPDHVKAFDMLACQNRDAKGRFLPMAGNGWRTLNTATLTMLKRGAEVYTVKA
jgi:hypothetical protein